MLNRKYQTENATSDIYLYTYIYIYIEFDKKFTNLTKLSLTLDLNF